MTNAVDVALDVARRRKRAAGGRVHSGPIPGAIGGRTDHVPMDVAPNSFVIPADVISGMGEGNTANGMAILERMFGDGGTPSGGDGDKAEGVPIMAASGEYVVTPAKVAEIGGGDPDKGHEILDDFVIKQRKKIIRTMQRLPGPAQK